MPIRTSRFYDNHLQKYFNKYFSVYAETAEWYTNPAINQWRFRIPELGLDITLTCYDDGEIVEKRRRVDVK